MSDLKKQLRPSIPSILNTENITGEEKFQNDVLRPIIKLQHDLIVTCFEHYLELNKVQIGSLNEERKALVIQKLFKSDLRMKAELRGLIIGLFTHEEYKLYLNLSNGLNKRIYAMIQQRVASVFL